MKRLWILAATISGAMASGAALPAGSVEAGATKAVICQACHGANGNSTNPEWPSLAGIGADYIADQLKDFKEGKRVNPVMMPMVASLTPDDMLASPCTSCSILQDRSAYWAPALYFRDDNGTYSLVPQIGGMTV